MDSNDQDSLEYKIDQLLNGSLDDLKRSELLWSITTDRCARKALKDAIDLQNQARAAYGYDRAATAMRASLAHVITALPDQQSPPRSISARTGSRRTLRHFWRASNLFRIAAVVVVAGSVYVAVTAHQAKRTIDKTLSSPLQQQLAMPKLTDHEVANLRRVWNEVRDRAEQSHPWIFFGNGSGQFGYMPLDDTTDEGKLVLVRCALLGPDGRNMGMMNLLVPSREGLRLTVPEAVRADNLPINFDVWIADRWAGVGLAAGGRSSGTGGIEGRADFGQDPVEIGHFLLNGKELRVILQAVPVQIPGGSPQTSET